MRSARPPDEPPPSSVFALDVRLLLGARFYGDCAHRFVHSGKAQEKRRIISMDSCGYFLREAVVVELLGEPKGKGRPRFVRATGHTYTPQRTASYEACLRHEAGLAMAGRPPLAGAVRVVVTAYFGIPQSWPQKKQAAALAGTVRPTTKPDWENVAKMLDALNGVVWIDDKQVVSGLIEKHYSDRPRLVVTVATAELIP